MGKVTAGATVTPGPTQSATAVPPAPATVQEPTGLPKDPLASAQRTAPQQARDTARKQVSRLAQKASLDPVVMAKRAADLRARAEKVKASRALKAAAGIRPTNYKQHHALPPIIGGPAYATTGTTNPSQSPRNRTAPRPLSSERDGGRGHAPPTSKTTSGSNHPAMGRPPSPRSQGAATKLHPHPG